MHFVFDIRDLSEELQNRVKKFFDKSTIITVPEHRPATFVSKLSNKGVEDNVAVPYMMSEAESDQLAYQIATGYGDVISIDFYEDIVCQIFTDFMIVHSNWDAGRNKIDSLILELFPWYNWQEAEDGDLLSPSHILYVGAIYPIIASVQEIMIGTIGIYESWDLWTTRRIGRNLVIERGIDYRIWDWERRNARGEFDN